MTSTSNQFSITSRDILRGLAIAVITPVFSIVIASLDAGSLVLNWKFIAAVALSSAMSYLLKNFLTPPRIVITEPDVVTAVKGGEATIKVVPLTEEGQVGSSNETFQSER